MRSALCFVISGFKANKMCPVSLVIVIKYIKYDDLLRNILRNYVSSKINAWSIRKNISKISRIIIGFTRKT